MTWYDRLAQEILEEAETLEDHAGTPDFDRKLQRVFQRGMAVGMFLAHRITHEELKQNIEEIDKQLPRR